MKTEALLTPHMIASLKPRARDYTIYDAGCSGLALRVQPTGARSWVTWERTKGKTRRITLGTLRDLTLEQARLALRRHQAGIRAAARPETRLTYRQLVKLFLAEKQDKYTTKTLSCLNSYLNTQLLPAFGNQQLHRITTPAVADWFYGYSQTHSGGANVALIHFTTIWKWGKQNEHIPKGLPNPAAPIRKNHRDPRGRMLNTADLKRLAAVLDAPPLRAGDAANAVRLILLTGCRSGEILRLSWAEVKRTRLNLTRTKTGPRTVLLSPEATAEFNRLREEQETNFVFPSPADPTRPRATIKGGWTRIKAAAKLPDTLRLHDLRHTYASHAVLAGESLYLTGKLLGHRKPQSTERYAHLDGKTLAKAADQVAAEIERMMGMG